MYVSKLEFVMMRVHRDRRSICPGTPVLTTEPEKSTRTFSTRRSQNSAGNFRKVEVFVEMNELGLGSGSC
jgi:hypothetical protein